MRTSTKAKGQSGEDAAIRYLESEGYRVIARNWRPGNALRGEIDCIAWDDAARGGKTLCFIEVKARHNRLAAPQEAVTLGKQRQISKLANAFVSLHKLGETPCRFDVVEVWLEEGENERNKRAPRCILHRGAFDYCG